MVVGYVDLKKTLSPLSKVSSKRIFIEMLLTAFIAWSFYIHALTHKVFLNALPSFFISLIFMYRGLSFIHEVAHFDQEFKWLRIVYNVFFGFFNKVPAYSMKTHRYHHGVKTFGRIEDPEYENWTARPKYYLARPLLLSLLYPFILTLRFAIYPFIFIVLPHKYKLITYKYASSFVMNLKYKRPFSNKDFLQMGRQDLGCSFYFVMFLILAVSFDILIEASIVWYAQIVIISWMNTYRALVAHRYIASVNEEESLEAQLVDSVTIEGSFLTEIWAPIGLRYHSTHHLFPKIPYYNLRKAHYIIKKNIDKSHIYHSTIEPNFMSAFKKLYHSCRG